MSVTDAGAPDIFATAITELLQANPNPYFVQVGGFDGVSFDPLRRQIVESNLSGLIIEPVPQYFDKLKALYAGSTTVTPVNCAIAEENGERTIWHFSPKAIEIGKLPPHFAGIASFVMEDLLKETGSLANSCPDAETLSVLRELLCPVKVQCRTMESLLREYGVERIDILQIDTEGYDYIILKSFDFERFRPSIVHYEHQHLSRADIAAAEGLLRSQGYRLRRDAYDTLAVRLAQNAQRFQFDALRSLALSLHADGRSQDAVILLEHLEWLQSDDPETLQSLARILGAQGQTLAALKKLSALRSVAPDVKSLAAEIRLQMPAAITCFNTHLAAGQVEEAEKYVAGLAALIPGNALVLNSALTCNLALGRREEAEKYASALLAVDRNNAAAIAVLTEHRV
jgi:FkbM family methyltransferase